MAVVGGAACVAAPFAGSLRALVRGLFANAFVYGACGVIALVALAVGAGALADERTSAITLPIGLALLGGHFRIDALSPFSLVLATRGGGGRTLYALAYARHESAPLRVLPFYPAF